MKLTVREDSKNYAATIVKLPPKQAVTGLDRLVRVTVFGNDVLTQKDADEQQLYIFFPAECCISEQYLSENNEFRHSEKNRDRSKTGFFDDTGRVKAIKFKGVISTGYIAPISTLRPVVQFNADRLKEGDEFTDIDGINICKKYRVIRQQGGGGTGESRHNKKLKRFDKLVPNQFRFHSDTAQLAKNLHVLDPDDIVVITDKWHGTSAVFANVLVNVDLKWYQKLALKLVLPSIRKFISTKAYDNLYASRSVVKNQYINKSAGPGYYNEDIWGIVNKELEGKIEQGCTLYGEIVGYLPSGKEIQKGYDYGCVNGEHKFVVYRITYTKPDGNTIEFSWQQIVNYCKRNGLETVKELYYGGANDLVLSDPASASFSESLLDLLQRTYLEKDCKYCTNKVPAEGICLRIDGRNTYSTFKLKAKRFLERETKQLDSGEVNIEDEQTAVDSHEGVTS